jgi:hypothetical protein
MSSPNPITSPLAPVLVVETGAIVAGANTYATLAEADAFFQDSVDTVWFSASERNKKVALISAVRYMQQRYRMQWKGARMDAFQALDWPRRGVDVPDFFDPYYTNAFVPNNFENSAFVPTNVIPNEVKVAQLLLARATLDSSGASTVVLQPALGRVTKREKLGDLEVEYADGAAGQRLQTIYWDSKEVLRPFLKPSSATTGTVLRS